ncbi:hypothetical protein DMC30DRAFT_418315 [Rhodotorula diobovata]|uniref:RING-type domain-containing protein n=1 Tax=Rhodotorula diobovata TaxID=5288 RepID=A0A5C5FQT7_9BASI|nr:hypothetical protein DMC30DRAFT_418315 [Rhodotorula diobovata]
MSRWQSRPLAAPAEPAQPLALSSDDDDAPSDVPPPEYFTAARSLAPTSSRRDALKAWDQTRTVGAGSSSADVLASARVQAALGALIDLVNSPAACPSAGPSGTSNKRPAASPSRPLGRSSPDTPPQSKRARIRAAAPKHTSKDKGKGKAVVVLDSDESDGDEPLVVGNHAVAVVSPVRERLARPDKGKGRAREQSEMLVLDSEADDEDVDKRAGPLEAPLRAATPARQAPPSPLTAVLAVLPEARPEFVSDLLAVPEHADGGATSVIDAMLGMKSYPRIGGDDQERGERKKGNDKEVDWLNVEARKRIGEVPSALYKKIALDQLYCDFDRIPSSLIKQSFLSPEHACFFAPTWTSLRAKLSAGDYDDQKLKSARKAPKPVVRIVRRQRVGRDGRTEEWDEEEVEGPPPELRREMDWLLNKIVADRAARRAADEEQRAAERERKRAERLNEQARAKGTAVECGCCFDEVAVENTAPCAEGHLFCKGCALANASDRIGRRQAVLPCMAADCTARFEPATYSTFLAPKMVESLAALAQQKDLDEAFNGVEGFEKCPFCPYACLVENPDERLFRCERPEGHVPLSCEEADEESRLPGVHAVAEAMSAALIRPCPKCTVPCLKSDGCNKMVCSQCGAYWCYSCRSPIKGYDHFPQKRADGSQCVLHDDTEMTDFNQVERARLRAQEALDARTAADAARLAAAKPVRGAPIYPAGYPLAGHGAGAAAAGPAAGPAPVPGFAVFPNVHVHVGFGADGGAAQVQAEIARAQAAMQQYLAQDLCLQLYTL